MDVLDTTLAGMAPAVKNYRRLEGEYNARHGLAIYSLVEGNSFLAQAGTILGEALAGRSGVGCTMLEGIPPRPPSGSVVVGLYDDLLVQRPDLLADLERPAHPGGFGISFNRNALVTATSREGIAAGIQTAAMLIMRHQGERIPGVVINDWPDRAIRCLAVELNPSELNPNLLIQILSFATTFRANAIEWILPADFNPWFQGNLAAIRSYCQATGLEVSVSFPHLGPLLRGELSLAKSQDLFQAAAVALGASRVSLDDPVPADFDPEKAIDLINNLQDVLLNGKSEIQRIGVDYRLLSATGVRPADLANAALEGWFRVEDAVPSEEYRGFPLRLDVPAHFLGLTSRSPTGYYTTLDATAAWCGHDGQGKMAISFRGVGFPHYWQNCLAAAATGLVLAWGNTSAASAADSFAHLIYGEQAEEMQAIWDNLGELYPSGLSSEEERRAGEFAFGLWPENPDDIAFITKANWTTTITRITTLVSQLEVTASHLTRNKATLTGPYLTIHFLAWLYRLAFLFPALGKAETAILAANELVKSLGDWRSFLTSLQTESGLASIDMEKLDHMGKRLEELVNGSPN
ncbi:MAG: hypothetical protein LBU79_04845 [Planctomycetota bacterium]|jgi:hypothetical protein|nr:hypothetical protein [Planctomycetota bacterium]